MSRSTSVVAASCSGLAFSRCSSESFSLPLPAFSLSRLLPHLSHQKATKRSSSYVVGSLAQSKSRMIDVRLIGHGPHGHTSRQEH